MGLRKKAMKGLTWMAIQNVGVRFSSFLVLLVLARLLEPADFGLVALATTAVAFMQTFVAGGFAAAIVQREEIEKSHLDTAFWINLGVSLLAMAGLWLAAGPLATAFKEPGLEPVLIALSFLLLFRGLNQVQIAILKRNLEFKSLAVRELISDPIGGIIGVAMAFSGYGVWSLVARELITSAMRLVILWSSTRWRPGIDFSWARFKELFSFGASVLGHNFVSFFSKRSADLLIGYFLGAATLGYFTVASRIFHMLNQALGGTLGNVAWPMFSRLQGDMERLRNVFYISTSTMCLIVWPTFIGLSVMAPKIVPIVFGSQWLPSIPVMQILAFLGLLKSISVLNDSVIMALGKPHWRLFLQIAVTITSVTGFFFVVESGIVGVALWYVFASYIFMPVSLWMINKLISVNPGMYFRAYAGPMIGSLAMAGVIFAIRPLLSEFTGPSMSMLFEIIAGALVYALIVSLISRSAVDEFKRFVREMRPMRRAAKGKTP